MVTRMWFSDAADLPFSGGRRDNQSSTRELVLVILEQLYISYDKLGLLDEADPLLERLMKIACAAKGENGGEFGEDAGFPPSDTPE